MTNWVTVGSQHLVSNIIKKAASRSLDRYGRSSDTSDYAHLRGDILTTKNFSFPLDVEQEPGLGNHGHFIMFEINEQQDAEIRFGNRKKDGATSVVEAAEQRNLPKYIKKAFGDSYQSVLNKRLADHQLLAGAPDDSIVHSTSGGLNYLENLTGTGGWVNPRLSGSTVFVKRKPTVRLDTAITLYMPPQVQFAYGAEYQNTGIGVSAKTVAGLYDAYKEGRLEQHIRGGAGGAREFFKDTLLVAADALVQGAKATYEMVQGVAITDRLELIFKGVPKRGFEYTFKMIPKNVAEAEEIRNIVFAFKANMLPEFKGGDRSGRSMRVPNTFDIKYMYHTGENDWLPKVSTCVLETMNVAYGGERYKTFHAVEDGAPPVETTVTLSFKELELITKERVFEGY